MNPQEAFHVECLRYGVDGNELKFGGRRSELVSQRCVIARALQARGFGFSAIGRAMNKDHSTVMYYLGLIKGRPERKRPLAPKPASLGGAGYGL